jgi:pilus assembly protein FimV
MSRRLIRISLTIVLLLSSKAWAIGLGEIRLQSALNEPLRAEIVLLSATPEELANLKVTLATADTFERYGIDRPFFLQGIQFNIVERGANDSVVQLRSAAPITEPFLTFLVEATWSRGRLLREYTVLLDPPTYAPPAAQQAPVVQAPSRSAPTDSARIERQPAPAPAAPSAAPRATAPSRQADSKPLPAMPDTPYDTSDGGEHTVQRGETLWGLASRMRPDSRLTMNQTMIAIFEANPQAFNGNINRLKAGANIRVPSADAVFQISRGEAFSAVQQQNAAWGGSVAAPSPQPAAPAPAEPEPSLVLVPPDDEDLGIGYEDDIADEADTNIVPTTREDEIEARIAALEAAEVPYQQSLIEIRDNELAALRQELAEIRGEVYEPPVDEAAEEPFVDEQGVAAETDDEILVDEGTDEQPVAEEPVADVQPETTPVARRQETGIVDKILDFLLGTWGIIIGVIVLVGGLLFWFMRRGSDEHDDSGPWEQLDEGDLATGAMTATETMPAPTGDDESIVVVEQDSGIRAMDDDTIEAAAVEMQGKTGTTGEFGSLEDTFSSETAVNLDQQDPLAEADFHMAYGLYDQAADLINGALEVEPQRQDLLAKLCEIYFVWGNRDAFVDAAKRLQSVVSDDDPDWNKTVIMGQQIAGEDALFAGASAGKTKAVDLSFEDGADQTGALDMDFGGADAADDGDDEVDFMFPDDDAGADAAADASAIDFDLESTAESPTLETPVDVHDPDSTVETPTIEQQFEGIEGTSELPSLDEDMLGQAIAESGQSSDATAEINLDELDLDIDSLAETELANLDDLDDLDATGANPEVDPTATGVQPIADTEETGTVEALDIDDALAATLESTNEMRLAPDETGASPLLDLEDATDIGMDTDLLDATGHTQVLSEDLAVDTGINKALSDADATMLAPGFDDDDTVLAGDEDATMLAPGLSGDDDFDFAKTEALPADVFTGNENLDETAEVPAVAGTDVDLDLDDLTAALKVSQAGDTVDMPRDDATVEQPRPKMPADGETVEMAPDDLSDDLNEARTMTEVGTKLDLARAYVDMGDPAGARSILEEVLDEGDASQRQQAQQLLDSLPS